MILKWALQMTDGSEVETKVGWLGGIPLLPKRTSSDVPKPFIRGLYSSSKGIRVPDFIGARWAILSGSGVQFTVEFPIRAIKVSCL